VHGKQLLRKPRLKQKRELEPLDGFKSVHGKQLLRNSRLRQKRELESLEWQRRLKRHGRHKTNQYQHPIAPLPIAPLI